MNIAMNRPTDLSVLALKAAAQLDAMKNGAVTKPDAFYCFVKRISDDPGVSAPERVKTLAPSKVQVIRQALSAFSGSDIRSADDLTRELKALSAYAVEERTPNADEIGRLISFCVEYHSRLMDQQRVTMGARRPHNQNRV